MNIDSSVIIIINYILVMLASGFILLSFTGKIHLVRKLDKFLVTAFVLMVISSVINGVESYLSTLETFTVWRLILSWFGYVLRPITILLFILAIYDTSKKMRWIISIPAMVNGVLYSTCFFNGWVFYFEKDTNDFNRGPLGYTVFAICGLYATLIVALAIMKLVARQKSEGLVLLFCVAFSAGASVIELFIRADGLYNVCLAASYLIYYLYLNIKYSREYEKRLIESQKTELMISQIQPHFMYNVLSSIYYLCDHDSKKAKEAVSLFSTYLRSNLDTIRNSSQIVSFTDELNYTKNYLSLEKIRFDEELNVVYDIQVSSFQVPKFTIQPLVENAVKHGISQKEGGGTVMIYTREEDGYIIVGIRDDGVGFDVNEKKNDGRSHTGVSSVSYRLLEYTGEALHIESRPGDGTNIWFRIRKQ